MIKSKLLTVFILSIVFIFGIAAESDCNSKKQNKNTRAGGNTIHNTINNNKMPGEETEPPAGGEIKVLAEGSYGKAEQPFLFVVRDAETYAPLKSMIENLPPASEIDFAKHSVIAAFGGTKNTGGYSVEIKKSGEKISISVKSPPPDAMVTEALTMPYKIAVVALEAENPLNLDVSENWKKAAQSYKVSSGEFEYSGGIAGRRKAFAAEGAIEVYQMGDLVTLIFKLAGKGENKGMRLTDTASGVLTGGKLELTRLDAGSFSEGPKPPLKVSGTMKDGELILNFEPLPSMIADGFQARGKLEAVKSK
jgi:hypothetical protein